MARELDIEEHVNFKGFLNGEPLVKEIVESTIVVIPSLYEGLPLTLLESMALGKPVVASKLPGICEVLENGVTGIIAHAGDVRSLSDRIKMLLDNPEPRNKIGNNAESAVKNNYTWNSIAKKTIELYLQTR
jgi:1,4-alpha-glucan branching enzyme